MEQQQSKVYLIILDGCPPQLIEIPAALDAGFLQQFGSYVVSVSKNYFDAIKQYATLLEAIHAKFNGHSN